MTDALLSAILPLTLLLLVCILFELIAPKQEYSLRSRWPGAFFIILFPAVGVLASYPLMLLLRAIGFPPLVNLS